MNDFVFSFIVSVYNTTKYLNDCLDSLVKLHGTNFEIIIVNDGSTDDSEKICRIYTEKYSFVKYYYKENGGLSSARNFGIEKASGDYLLFIDSDDFLLNDDFIGKINDILKKYRVEFLGFLPIEFDENRKKVLKKHEIDVSIIGTVLKANDILNKLYFSDNPYITMAQTKIICKKYLIENGLYFENNIYHEDDEWIVRTLLSNPSVFFADLEEYGYRRREGSIITSKEQTKQLKRCYDMMKIVDKIFGINDIYRYRQCVTYFINYYIQAAKKICANDEQRRLYFENTDKNNVFHALRYSLSRKHRLLYMFKKVFGIKLTKKIIIKK
ncbi:MAG: glycosyltransferase [Clostridia bacterium]|nr:glycosyltransferase [Clostridia bacterium]